MRGVLMLGSIVGVLLLTLAIGASRFLMIDQGDYPRTVSRIVAAPVDEIALPHSRAVATRWRLDPPSAMRPNLSSGSASMAFHALALAQSPLGAYDVRAVGAASAVLTGLGVVLAALLLVRAAGAGAAAGLVAASIALPLALAAHNSAFLTSFYGEFAFVVAAPWVLVALLLSPSRARSALLFIAVAIAALAKAQNLMLPTLLLALAALPAVAGGRAAAFDPRLRRIDVAGLLAIQLMALAMVAKGDYGHYNAHHATYLGAFFVVGTADVERSGVAPPAEGCIGVDRWGNRLATVDSTTPLPAPAHCRGAPPRSMADVLALYAESPAALFVLAAKALPVHATVDYFHVAREARYVHAVEPTSATRVLQQVSRWRDAVIRGSGVVIVPLLFLLSAAGLARGRYRAAAFPLTVLALFTLSQIGVSLLGEGVRDLSKHLAMGQYAIDLGLVVLAAVGVAALSTAVTSAGRAASTRSSRAR